MAINQEIKKKQFRIDQVYCFVYKLEYPYEYHGTSSKPIDLGFHCTAEKDFRNKDSTTFDEIQRLTKSFQ